jgi:SAM-dependent methyltransferase
VTTHVANPLEAFSALARSGQRERFHEAIWRDWQVLHDYLGSFVLDNAGSEFVVPYLNDALPRFLRTLDILPLRSALRVLEFGANPYLFSILVKQLLDYELEFANFTGATIFDTEVTHGVQRVSSDRYAEKYSFEYTSFNIELSPSPYPPKSFDAILFCEILEHLVIDPISIFPKLLDMLKPGGVLVLTTPNAVRLVNFAYMLAGTNFFDRYHPANGIYGRHNREFTVAEVDRLLSDAGFVNRRVTTADRYNYDEIEIWKDNYEEPARLPFTRTKLEELLQLVGAETENRGDNIYAVAERPVPDEKP